MSTIALLALSACTTGANTTTTVEPIPPPPNPTAATDEPSVPPIEGALPDGTDYRVYLETASSESLEAITGDIMYEIDGQIWWAAEVEFVPELQDGAAVEGNVYRIPAGRFWSADLTFLDEFLEMLGDDAEPVILDSVAGFDRRNSSTRPFPVLDLTPPFRWSTQYDPTGPMEVQYSTIIVTPGCDPDAGACTVQETLQVMRRPFYTASNVTIESTAPRPLSDPYYLDPGPLFDQTRVGPDVIWTGEEMIVWGGRASDLAYLTDGGTFNPNTGEWRRIEPGEDIPPAGVLTRAVWAADRLVVLVEGGVLTHEPGVGSWSSRPAELVVPHRGGMASNGDLVFLISNGAVASYDVASSEFGELSLQPSFSVGDVFGQSHLEPYGEGVLLSWRGDRCDDRSVMRSDGNSWIRLPETSLATSSDMECSTANQLAVVGERILIWDDAFNLTKVFDGATWIEVERIPVFGWESPSSALVAGSQVLVPDGRNVAIFDMDSLTWEEDTLPGPITTGTEWVWTGSEVLAWVDGRDAWRWTPPE